MPATSALAHLPIESVTHAPSLCLIAPRPSQHRTALLDPLQLREVLSSISMNARSIDAAVSYGPHGPEDRTLRLPEIHHLLLQQRVHAATIVYRIGERTRTERFVCSRDGFLHSSSSP